MTLQELIDRLNELVKDRPEFNHVEIMLYGKVYPTGARIQIQGVCRHGGNVISLEAHEENEEL